MAPELSTEERAYFESRGETAPPEEVAVTEAPAEQEAAQPAEPAEGTEPTAADGAGSAAPVEKPRDEKGKFVPHQALHEERERRKAAEERVKQYEDLVLKRIEAIQQPQQQDTPPVEIDPEADPVAAVKAHHAELAEFRQWRDQQAQHAQQQHQFQQVMSRYSAAAEEYRASAPDFNEAYGHLLRDRGAELAEMGVPQQEIPNVLHREELAIAMQAMQGGRNPAEIIYALAKRRGYRAAAATQEQQQPDPAAAADRLATVAAGQQAQRSIGQAGGGATPDLSVDSLLKMNDDDFMKAIKSGSFRKVAGG